MDLTTRGIISSIINNNYESQKVLKTIKWILEIDDEVYCKEDLALGYFMGALVQISSNSTSMMKRNALIDDQYRKSLEKIYGGKEGKIQYLEYKMKTEELAKKEREVKWLSHMFLFLLQELLRLFQRVVHRPLHVFVDHQLVYDLAQQRVR